MQNVKQGLQQMLQKLAALFRNKCDTCPHCQQVEHDEHEDVEQSQYMPMYFDKSFEEEELPTILQRQAD